ncbi:MAG: AAA family ATPase [Candidatus Poseidonia sp.]|nr:AAA family ATPase [Poseidonia sp.]
MSVWLESYKPQLFSELLTSPSVIEALTHLSLQSNPPHLLLSGSSGCGKTTAYQLLCRQVLGPSWRSTTHVLQARDLDKTSGAMAKFEAFLRPAGSGSEDTLAGRTSLDAFDHTISATSDTSPPPAGQPSATLASGLTPVSRIIVIEDADYLGHARQSYLRRMMEESSRSARFVFTTTTPSRVIEALRSRTQHLRMPNLTRVMMEQRLEYIADAEGLSPSPGVLGDIAHVASGNLRKAIFILQLMAQRALLDERKNIQLLMANSTRREVQFVLEEALRGRVHEWKWERQGEKNTRVLKGAMGALDQMMAVHDLDGRAFVDRLHEFLVAGRSHYPDPMLAALLDAVSLCDTKLQHSTQPRIQLEELMHVVAEIGKQHATASL